LKQAVLIFVLLLYSCSFTAEENVVITIEGMSCGSCVQKITNALTSIDGVKTADVKLKPGSATVVFEGDKTNRNNLLNAIAALGYKASAEAITAGEATHCQDEAKAASGASISNVVKAETPAEAELAVRQAKTPISGCPIAKSCAKAGSKPACGTAAVSIQAETAAIAPKTADTHEGHACPTDTKCKELDEFHEAMHPLHMALENTDYDAIRAGYPMLVSKADALKNLKCAETCAADKKDFDKKRDNLIKEVASLGKAVKGSDNEKLALGFDKMHAAYVELGNLCVKKN